MAQKRVAFMFDFDGTLINGFMQDKDMLAGLKITPEKFWEEVYAFAEFNNMDNTNAYLYKTLEIAKKSGVKLSREFFENCGKNLDFFNGVKEFFPRIKEYAKSLGLQLEYYIISSGNKEIIEGTDICNVFNRIFASEYIYNENGEPIWIGHNVNYTVKTQYIHRVRKNLTDRLYDAKEVNQYVSSKNQMPYANMVYFGDGFTDIPSMKIVHTNGGNSICVYVPQDKQKAEQLLEQGRVSYTALADYSEDSRIDKICKSILYEIALKQQR